MDCFMYVDHFLISFNHNASCVKFLEAIGVGATRKATMLYYSLTASLP